MINCLKEKETEKLIHTYMFVYKDTNTTLLQTLATYDYNHKLMLWHLLLPSKKLHSLQNPGNRFLHCNVCLSMCLIFSLYLTPKWVCVSVAGYYWYVAKLRVCIYDLSSPKRFDLAFTMSRQICTSKTKQSCKFIKT